MTESSMIGLGAMNSELTVYIVDADSALSRDLQQSLEAVGIQTEAYQCGSEFLEAFDQSRLGCLLLGIQPPGLTDLELLDRLRAQNATIPVIAMTGCRDCALAVRAMKMGAVDVLEKPTGKQTLYEAVWNALRRHAQIRQRCFVQNQLRTRLQLLSPRERQILTHVMAGDSSRQIAQELCVSPKTVENHRTSIMNKMQVRRAVDLVRMVCQCVSLDQITTQGCNQENWMQTPGPMPLAS